MPASALIGSEFFYTPSLSWVSLNVCAFFCISPALYRRNFLPPEKLFAAVGFACIIVIAFFCIWGVISAVHVRSTSYDVTIDKDGGKLDELNIALAADLHLGYTVGPKMMRQMVEKINTQNPDIVLIAGDIFDNDYDAMRKPEELIQILSQIHSKYGIYAVYGNHDTDEKILAVSHFLQKRKRPAIPEWMIFSIGPVSN